MNTKVLPFGVMVSNEDTHYAKWIEEAGRLDIASEFISRFSQHIPMGGTVIDIGACMGDHTATYSHLVGPLGRVVALECGGESFACLSYNMEPYANVLPMKLAAGQITQRASFVRSPNLGASHLVQDPTGSVQVISIDNLVNCLNIWPNLIKIDAEGFELKILKGANTVLRDMHPVLVIEINQGALERQGTTKEQVFQELLEAGYEYRIIGNNHLEEPQYDILATRR